MSKSDEYQTLRQEILDSFTREVNLIALGFTATAAIIGYGFTLPKPPPLLFLTPILILTLIFLQLINSIFSILTISVYIRVFLEDESNSPYWETTISGLRAKFRDEAKEKKRKKTKSKGEQKQPVLEKQEGERTNGKDEEFKYLYHPETQLTELWYALAATLASAICFALAFWYAFLDAVMYVTIGVSLIVCAFLFFLMWRRFLWAISGDYEAKITKELQNRYNQKIFKELEQSKKDANNSVQP